MPHIEKRKLGWYATLTVPLKARDQVGRSKFIQSLKTQSKREALVLAPPLIARWKAEIRQAMGEENALLCEALRWREDIFNGRTNADKDAAQEHLYDRTLKLLDEGVPEDLASSFYKVGLGLHTLTTPQYEDWKAGLRVVPKTLDQMAKDVQTFLKAFPAIEQIQKQSLKKWVDDLTQKGVSPSSIKRMLGSAKSFWRHLQRESLVAAELDPFKGLIETTKAKRNSKESWIAFAPKDINKLRNLALEKSDSQLADLIWIAAHSGARIEELCSLKCADVEDHSFTILQAKTVAGNRVVPIHSAIQPLIRKLMDSSKDGYLLAGLTQNKYGDRSNAIGKRFGRLKTTAGFSSSYVFHSIRKTFVTQLDNAGVSESVAADLVGHEKPNLTFGLYSNGSTLAVKQQAIEKVSY